jgi:lipoprotein signal peptidase
MSPLLRRTSITFLAALVVACAASALARASLLPETIYNEHARSLPQVLFLLAACSGAFTLLLRRAPSPVLACGCGLFFAGFLANMGSHFILGSTADFIPLPWPSGAVCDIADMELACGALIALAFAAIGPFRAKRVATS